ncbi:TPR-like protein [Mytilinidion resinicola]|uniref:TPR-like protein n=1 Tax=Mytilinidion resinicola TaxID=574789 RepID=A0A6A6YX21_9PEZI|nr:TPR-like protein [Mytilinidion resinicola]KAF2812457.1 TPR-like protein [Mytilinidion resinicola]
MPTLKMPRAARRPGAAASQQTRLLTESASLVDFLNAVQQNGISFLPVSWHKGLGILGRGLSGGIQQSTADVATVLAFKEGIPSKHERDTEQDQDWYSLVTEITVLQHKSIRENPYITDLIGVSFYVEPNAGTEKRAWPLLVTSKVNRGDLSTMLTNEQQGLLTENMRMQLFAEIAEAVYTLHACGVSHGDIKPDNFLIEESDEREINCLLIDFGSSTIRGQERLPTTNEPWNAPELEDASRSLGFEELAQTDIFSLGLVCFHLLLPLETLENANLCLIRRPAQSDVHWVQFIQQMKKLKEVEVGQTLSVRMLDTIKKSDVSTEQKDILRNIVVSTIQPQSGGRTIPWADILPHIEKHLSHSFNDNPNTLVNPPPLTCSSIALDLSKHSVFDLAAALGELDDTDYVLRANITQDLAYKAKCSACDACKLQYAFHVTVCHTIGFGCSQDTEISRQWLVKSGKTQEDVDLAVQRISTAYQITGRVARSAYQISRRLPDAEKSLKEEIEGRTRVFGETSCCLARLQLELSLVLKAQNRLADAERFQREAANILTQRFGERHPSSLLAKITLADTLADQGWLRKAGDLHRHVQPILKDVLGAEHPETATALQIMATTLTNLGEYIEAKTILREVVSIRNKVLTPAHPSTVNAELSLVSVLRAQGSLNQALDLMKSIDDKLANMLAGDDLTKAQLCISQAFLYREMRLLDRATTTITEALTAINRLKLPGDDRLRLTALQMLATIHGAGQEWDKEEAVLCQVLDAINSPDEKNREWSITKCLLAENLLSQHRLDEASAVADKVMASSGRSVAEDPENYVACAEVLATVLSYQGQTEEAEKILRSLLESCEAKFGEDNYLTLDVAYSLGVFFANQGAYDKAQQLYERVLRHLRNASGLGKDAIKVGRLLAIAYSEQGNFEKAKQQCEEAAVWAKDAVGEKHIEALAVYNVLAATYTQMGRYSDAEESFTRVEKQSQGSDLEIFVKENMSELRQQQGRLEEATDLMAEAHRLMTLMYGKSHPNLIKMKGNILAGALSQAEPLTDELEREVLENLQLKKEILGAVHPSTIKTMGDLAYAYGQRGRLEDSEKLFEEIWELGGVEVVQSPQRYATLLGRRAEVYFRTGRFEKAEELERKSLAVRQHIFRDDHRAVLVSMANLASTLNAQEKYTEAEIYLRRILIVREGLLVTDTQSIFSLLKSRVSLAAVLFFQKKLQESFQLYLGAVEAAERVGLPATIVDIWKADLENVLQDMTEQEVTQQGVAEGVAEPETTN